MTLAAPVLFAARHGRMTLVAGLVAGIALPGLAEALKPFIGEMVAGLLFLAALRVGPRQAVGALADLKTSFAFTLLFQLAMPVAAVFAFATLGWNGVLATGLVLMLAGAPISGSPNLALLTGNDPAPALRQLVVGTALLPLTVIPVFWLAPALGNAGVVIGAAARLLVIIAVAAGAAFAIRVFIFKTLSARQLGVIDGWSAIGMAVVVVGLMAAVGPAMRAPSMVLAAALAAAFAGNFACQIAMALILRPRMSQHMTAPLAIVAGNRNVALFLAALPAAVTDPLLLFIGCYQIPMYLTPILLGWLYRRGSAASS